MQRVWVVGNSGSGKTTVARSLAVRMGARYLELDSVYHQAGWRPMEPQKFRDRVAEHVAEPAWVVDGNYSEVSDLMLGRADTVLWIDLPRLAVMRQLAGRTIRRGLLRQELWNGNRERLSGVLSRDPEKSIMLWAWRHHGLYAERYADLARRTQVSGHGCGLNPVVVRLRSRREIDAFLSGFDAGPG